MSFTVNNAKGVAEIVSSSSLYDINKCSELEKVAGAAAGTVTCSLHP